jgi:hypothetical protein
MAEELADIQATEGAVSSEGQLGPAPVETGTEPPSKPVSIRDSIKAAVKEAEAPKVPKPKESAAPEKIAAALKESPPASVPAAQDPAKTGSDPHQAPSSWSKEVLPLWESLPQGVKDEVRKRESDFQKGIEKYKDKATRHDEIAQVLTPIRPILQQYGIANDAQAVSRLVEWENSLRNPQTRMAAFHNLARTYGIDLSQAQQSAQDMAQDIPEPLRPVLDKFGQLEQQVTSLVGAQQYAEQQRAAQELSTFAKDHPHFDAVRQTMGQLMAGGAAQTMQEAYDKAIWANDDLREQILRDREEKKATEKAKADAEAAKAARLAAASPPAKARQGVPGNGLAKGSTAVRGSILKAINDLREDSRA